MDERGDDTGTWVGELRREAFFFPSGERQLYGSLYAAVEPAPAHGVVLCNSWGFEGNQSDATIQRIALQSARDGGAAAVFHYPGFGDSEGDPGEATLEALAASAVDALAEVSRRLPGTSWTLAGLMLGASVAALAAARGGAERLLLVQPALQPSLYFARLERSARRAAVRVPARVGNAYGYPLPRPILAATEPADAAVAEALSGFAGPSAAVRYEQPPRDEVLPDRCEDVVLPGTWRFGARQKPELADAVGEWLRGAAAEAAAG